MRFLPFLILSLCLITDNIDAQKTKYTSDIWKFSKESKKNHTVLSVSDFQKGDTLSLQIGNLVVFENWIVGDTTERYYETDLNGYHWLFYFIVFSSNNKLKYIYNQDCKSEFYYFPQKKGDDRHYAIVFVKNGKTFQGVQSKKMRWQRIDGDIINEQFTFRGLD